MAILIPSKNIYKKQNPKVRDNAINRLNIQTKEVSPLHDYDTNVFNANYASEVIENYGLENTGNIFDFAIGRENAGTVYTYGYGVSYLGVEPTYFPYDKSIKISIPKNKNNSIIEYLKVGEKDGEKAIKVSIEYGKEYGQATGFCEVKDGKSTNVEDVKLTFDENNRIEYGSAETPKVELTHKYTWNSAHIENQSYSQTVDISKKFETLDNVGNAHFTEQEDFFIIYLKIFCGYQRIAMGGYTPPKIGNQSDKVRVNLSGQVEVFSPIAINISFYGDLFGISINDKKTYISTENLNGVEISMDGNELTQETNYYKNPDDNSETSLVELQANNILDGYKGGKETATFNCSISNYYDEEGNLAISTGSENLLNANDYLSISNGVFEDGIVTQKEADTNTSPELDFYLDGGTNISNWEAIPIGGAYDISTKQRIFIKFRKEKEIPIIRFKYNGKSKDTSILFDVSNLIDGESYTFSATIKNLTQGQISWGEMQITVGNEQKSYTPWFPMLFQEYDKVIPMDYVTELLGLYRRSKANEIGSFSENLYYFGFNGETLNESAIGADSGVSYKDITVTTTAQWYNYGIGFPIKVEPYEKLNVAFDVDGGANNWKIFGYFYDENQNGISTKEFIKGRELVVPNQSNWLILTFYSTVGATATFKNIVVTSNKKHDRAMSIYSDGSPKEFQVLRSKVYYDGRVMQEIEVQEIPFEKGIMNNLSYMVSFFLYGNRYRTAYTNNSIVEAEMFAPPSQEEIGAGYYFDGWYTEVNGGGQKVTPTTLFTRRTNLYAYIVEDTTSYGDTKITFYAPTSAQMQKDGDKREVKTTYTNGGGYLETIPTWEIPYYTFLGWYTLKGEKITLSYKFLEDTNVYAMYVEKTAHTMDLPTNISDLKNDSGFLTSSGVVDIINETVIPSISANTQDINSLRSELNKNNETLSGSIANISERVTNAEKDIISIKGEDYARYTITFMRNYNSSDNVVLFQLLTDNKQALTSLPTATREGYDFEGWFTQSNGGSKITTNVQYNKDTTVYAQWKEKSAQQTTVTLTIKNNVNANTITKTYTAGSLYTFDTPAFSITEKEFDKWTVGSAINEIGFNPNAPSVYAKGSIISLTENTTIYANYGTPKQYNVVFCVYNKNHTLSGLSALPTTGNGVIIFPTQPDPTNYGYTENSSFAGWFTYTGTYQYKQGDKVFQDNTYIYGSFEENPTNEPEEYEKYTDFISYSNIEDGYTSGWGANGLDITKLEEYLETTSPNDNNRYEIKIAPNYQTNIIQTIHSYSFVDYSDITNEKTLEYVIPPTVTSFGLRAFYLKNATIRFLGTQEQFEEILRNSPTEWATSDYEGKMFEVIVYFGYEDTVGTIYVVLRQE